MRPRQWTAHLRQTLDVVSQVGSQSTVSTPETNAIRVTQCWQHRGTVTVHMMSYSHGGPSCPEWHDVHGVGYSSP
jgi:hypothetical protein